MTRQFDLIVFDWDGTLLDSTSTIARCIQAAARDVDLPEPSFQIASHVIGLGLQDALSHVAPTATREQIMQMAQRYRVHYLASDEHLSLFEGTEIFLQNLSDAGYRLAVATGKHRAGLNRALLQTRIGHYFEATRTADETASKPDPLMLLELMQQCQVRAERVLMIGDTTHDLKMALAAGVSSAAVSSGAHSEEQLRTYKTFAHVSTVVDLAPWLVDTSPTPKKTACLNFRKMRTQHEQ